MQLSYSPGAGNYEPGLDRTEWYAIHTRSNFEKRIAGELSVRGIPSYLPAYVEVHQWKDRKQNVSIPLFPGYVFAQFCDFPDARLQVLKTSGVVRILGHGSDIEPVPEGEIEAVRRILDARVSCFAHPLLREGRPVRVVRGPLSGVEGILARIKNQSRLVVSIPLLNQSVAAEMAAWDVEPISIR
jgi:transcription termination/antitermination protein NusG